MLRNFKNENGEVMSFELPDGSRKRVIIENDVKWKRVPALKYKSRATRCADICAEYTAVIDKLRNFSITVDELNIEEIKEKAEEIEIDVSELEGLKDEIDEWESSMEGTNLENTEKYEQLGECCDALDNAVCELEGIEINIDGTDEEDVANQLDTLADEIESAVSEIEYIEFPGMY
jgi:chromosome segregation ATPase